MMVILKELIVILVIAAAVFRLAKPVAVLFSSEKDFSRRRNVWFALTCAAFLSPNFLLFAVVAIPILVWAGRADSNPAALYLLLLQVIPSISVTVPMVGISRLFNIDNYFLLSFFVMLPAAYRLRKSKERPGIRGLETMDVLLLSFGLLTAFLYLHPEISRNEVNAFTFTDALRRAFLFFVTIYVPYFVISRSVSSRRIIVEDMAALCLSCALMAAIAIFEATRHWLVYADLADHWGYGIPISSYDLRNADLRAMAAAGHPLALGYLLAMGFGFWLYLQSHLKLARYRFGVPLLLWLGLVVTYSRGPWIIAAGVFFIFYAVRPGAIVGLLKAASIATIVVLLISFSPLGEKVINALPFFSASQEDASVLYRHRLLDEAWPIIQESPWLGDQYALLKMQDLRQGEGIIDVINTFIGVLLGNGFVGLSLFFGFILMALFKSLVWCKRSGPTDRDFGLLGASLVSCILGTLGMMADGSFAGILEELFYALAGLATAYAYLGRTRQPEPRGRAATSSPTRQQIEIPN
jgi:O-antigen ligase